MKIVAGVNRSPTETAAALMFVALLPLMIWVPALFGHAPDVHSVAQVEGYNNRIAHLLALIWTLATVGIVGFLTREKSFEAIAAPHPVARPSRFAGWWQAGVILLGVAILYFPPALARYGPYLEDSIHLSAVHRMLAGDIPYRDFEFLYGPLMLYPAYFWAKVTGFSLTSFYTYVMLLEMAVFVAVFIPVQAYLHGVWQRLGAFVLLAVFCFNPLVGPNQNGLRKVAGILIMLSVATRPYSRPLWLVHGAAIGALLSYSQEFGGATAVGVAAIYAVLFFKTRDRRAVVALAVTGLVSALTWFGVVWMLMGTESLSYFHSLRYLTERFDAGEAAFRFYWTVSSLMVFGILFLAAWHVGRMLSKRWAGSVPPGDLVFVGGLAYALFGLKSGLSRADQYHLVAPILPLVFALVLFVPTQSVPLGRGARWFGIGLATVMALAYLMGTYYVCQYVFRGGVIKGYADLVSGHKPPPPPEIEPAHSAILFNQTHPSQTLRDLSVFLSTPPQKGRRLFVYGRHWSLPTIVGALKGGPLGDDFIYGDDQGTEMIDYLDRHPAALIVILKDDLDWLRQGPDAPLPESARFHLGGKGWKRTMLAYVSSVHFRESPMETQIKQERWRRLVGLHIVRHYRPIATFGSYCILERSNQSQQ